MFSRQRKYELKLRKWARYVLGDKCWVCGETENLDMDHIIPREPDKWGNRRSNERCIMYRSIIKGTSLNFQLLCKFCHMIKTRRDVMNRIYKYI